MVETDLIEGIKKFQKDELPRSIVGIDKQESSVRRERSALDNVIAYLEEHGLRKFKNFDRETAQEYLDYRKNKGRAPATIKEERRLLNNFFKWAMEMHYCSENPMAKTIAPKSIKKKPRFFSFKELAMTPKIRIPLIRTSAQKSFQIWKDFWTYKRVNYHPISTSIRKHVRSCTDSII